MKRLESLIVSLGGEKINKMKNIMTPSFLYRLPNEIYIKIEYDPREGYKEVRLGRLFLIKDIFPRLIVLEDFEELLKAAKLIELDISYTLPYNKLSYEQTIENVILNLKKVLDNYDKLYEISRQATEQREKQLEKYLIKDVSSCSVEEITKEASLYIYKPKAQEIGNAKFKNTLQQKIKKDSDELREKYNIPNNIYTYAEYTVLTEKKKNVPLLFALAAIFMVAAVIVWMVCLLNSNLIHGSNIAYCGFVYIGLALAGLVCMLKLHFRHPEKIFTPFLCYVLSFVLFDQIIKVEEELWLTLGTITTGTAIFVYWLICAVIIPRKKKKKATAEYKEKFYKEHGQINSLSGDFRDYEVLNLFLESGRRVLIFSLNGTQHEITVMGTIRYKNILTEEVPIDYLKIECDYAEAVAKAIELLEKNDQLFISKE